jgi:flagellar protein FlaG
MASDINEMIAPVVGQFRNSISSADANATVRGSADRVQGRGSINPSPGNDGRVEEKQNNKNSSKAAVEKAVQRATELARSLSRKLSFSYDDRINKVIVRVMEGESDKLVRQIPAEEMIRLSVRMDEIMGMLIDQDV